MKREALVAALLSAAPARAQQARELPPSLWDRIQAGAPITEEDLVASKELDDERFAEAELLGGGLGAVQPSADYYLDPLAALRPDRLHVDRLDPSEFDVPVVFNELVERWMLYFLGKGRPWFQRYLARAPRYEPMIRAWLRVSDLPGDLVYVAMIESGFSPRARSHASAVGLWQFIASTGRAYGLRVDTWVDERRDPEASTRAAARYLGDLHDRFDDWYLAWAAYDTGPARVQAAIAAHGTSDYWELVRARALHPEARNYVAKVLAAAILARHPERYGFEVPRPASPLAYDTVEVEGSVGLDALARCAGTTVAALRELNPGLLRGATPPQGSTRLHVPPGRAPDFSKALAALGPEERLAWRHHVVRRGESLGAIARSFGVTAGELARANGIRDPDLIYAGMRLEIPVRGGSAAARQPAARQRAMRYTVRRRDTLVAIAARYGVDPDQLAAWNHIRDPDHIEVGTVLVLHGGDPAAREALECTVHRGDTLTAIASRYGVSAAQLAEWNGISLSAPIHPGQVLKVFSPADRWVRYTVRPGDNLTAIARAHGCSVAELRSWNGLTGSTIHPGEKLRVEVR